MVAETSWFLDTVANANDTVKVNVFAELIRHS